MTLQQLKYAITISETGSFNKAAEVLYVSQPSLTGAIQDLEADVGISIFYRSGRGVTLTNDGAEFLLYARQIYGQYESMLEKYGKGGNRKTKFGVSAQHFSFAVKAFVEMVKAYDKTKYDFAIRETKTADVLEDVRTMRSEIGIIYLSDFNRKAIGKLLSSANLEFHPLAECRSYVYLCKEHPLANERSLRFEQLADYPCLAFEQGDRASFYLAEELFSTNEYPCTIRVCDRATVLNLMVGLDAYIICSGIICEELNGTGFVAVPLDTGLSGDAEAKMEIGYIVRKDSSLSKMASLYINEMQTYLEHETHRIRNAEL